MSRKGCFACRADVCQDNDRWDAALEKINARRASIGWKPFHVWGRRGQPDLFGEYWRDYEIPEVCARVFGGATNYWDKKAGYFRDEVKAALRRSPAEKKAKREKGYPYRYLPLNYTLPLPTLAATAKRLANAVVTCEDEQWRGPRAAEEYVAYRRAQLGLDLEVAA